MFHAKVSQPSSEMLFPASSLLVAGVRPVRKVPFVYKSEQSDYY